MPFLRWLRRNGRLVGYYSKLLQLNCGCGECKNAYWRESETKRNLEGDCMELGDAGQKQPEIVATVEGKKKLPREKTIKIRATILEIQEWDRLASLAGYKERATFFRKLVAKYPKLEQAERIVATYKAKKDAEATFNAVMDSQ